MTDEIRTIQEIAALLKLVDKTVYSMAQTGELLEVREDSPPYGGDS